MSECRAGTDSMMSKVSLTQTNSPLIEPKSSMLESVQKDSEMISPTKLDISGKDTQIMTSLRISEVGLISKEKGLSRFWTDSHLELSRRLLSLTEIDSVGLDFKCWRDLQIKTTAGSWFSIIHKSPLRRNLSKTLFPSSMYSPVEFMDSGNTLTKSRKIRIYPNKEDSNRFKQYLGLTRYWFNAAVEHLKTKGSVASLYKVRSIQKDPKHPEWAFNSPQRIREFAIKDACKAVSNAKRKFLKTGEFQEVHYRCKRDKKQGFGFDKQSLKDCSVFVGRNKVSFFSTEDTLVNLEGTRIICENGRWFLVLPTTTTVKKPENQRLGAVALDPGVRTFQTFFNPFVCGKVGESDFDRIYRLCVRVDKVISKLTKSDYRARRRISKAIDRLKWKIKDSINDLHRKFASFLVKNFDIVFIPTFETSNMVSKLRSKTARSMLTWAHYRFKEFLKFKGREYSCTIMEVSEAYTSRTCSFCGKDHNIQSKSIMRCSCGVEIDRDLNGARGIFLKSMLLAMPASALLS